MKPFTPRMVLAFAALVLGSVASAQEIIATARNTDLLRRYCATDGTLIDVLVPGGTGGLNSPRDLVFGPDGLLYVASELTDSVIRFNSVTGAVVDTFVTAQSGGLDLPVGLLFGNEAASATDGIPELYVCSFNTDRVLRYNGATGAFIDEFVTQGSGSLDAPYKMTYGLDGNLYVSSYLNDRVLRYDGNTGAFIDTFVTAGSGSLDGPAGLVFGPDGNHDGVADLYVCSSLNARVLRYDGTNGAFLDQFVTPGSGTLVTPTDIDFGPDGNVLVCGRDGNKILQYDGTTGAFIGIFAQGTVQQPESLVFRNGDACEDGTVHLGRGCHVPAMSLESATGLPGTHEIDLAVGQQLHFGLRASPDGPAPGNYVLYVWLGNPTGQYDLYDPFLDRTIGCLVNPSPFHGDGMGNLLQPQPFRCARHGFAGTWSAGCQTLASPLNVPFAVTRVGFNRRITLTLQAVIEDTGAANALHYSTTNAIVARIR